MIEKMTITVPKKYSCLITCIQILYSMGYKWRDITYLNDSNVYVGGLNWDLWYPQDRHGGSIAFTLYTSGFITCSVLYTDADPDFKELLTQLPKYTMD